MPRRPWMAESGASDSGGSVQAVQLGSRNARPGSPVRRDLRMRGPAHGFVRAVALGFRLDHRLGLGARDIGAQIATVEQLAVCQLLQVLPERGHVHTLCVLMERQDRLVAAGKKAILLQPKVEFHSTRMPR